jgi:diguanylate cyclase
MLDIDDFKRVNDVHGHPFGDKVLTKLADIVKESIRETDTAARYGGEEFAVILPKVDSANAAVLAQRIRKQIKSGTSGLMRGKGRLTVSIGISSFPLDGRSRMEIVKSADKALYEAKRRGKDAVVEHRELR